VARNVMDDIRASARAFDIDSLESDEIAAHDIDEVAGDQDETDIEDRNVPDAIPFAAAVSVVEGSQSDSFHVFRATAESLMNKYIAEGKSAKATQDHRTYHTTMAQGIENVLVALAEHIEAATERVKAASSEEKRHLGVNVKRVIAVGPSSLEESKTSGFVSTDGQHVHLDGMNVVAAKVQPKN
jgi:hypothetical protein